LLKSNDEIAEEVQAEQQMMQGQQAMQMMQQGAEIAKTAGEAGLTIVE
jgi:hypothetical protein